MQRALNRAYQRLQGNHPKPSESASKPLTTLLCDLLLAVAISVFLVGLALVIWSVASKLELFRLFGGLALMVLGPVLLLLWEHVFWEPFARDMARMS